MGFIPHIVIFLRDLAIHNYSIMQYLTMTLLIRITHIFFIQQEYDIKRNPLYMHVLVHVHVHVHVHIGPGWLTT